jgi:hypothetical protein
LELIRTLQVQFQADDVNLLDENIHPTERITESPFHASKEIGSEVNREETNSMSPEWKKYS